MEIEFNKKVDKELKLRINSLNAVQRDEKKKFDKMYV